MKKLLVVLLMVPTLAFGQTIASRRYAELTPEQYVFGPMTPVAPFNAAPNHTTASDSNVQPSAFIQSDNTFTSTANFDVIQQTSPATTFSVASNVGTITSTANTPYLLGDPATSFSAPFVFTQITVVSNGAAGTEFALALSDSTASTYLMADMYLPGHACNVVLYTAGAFHNISTPTCTLPSTPWRLGLSLVGNDACFWINSGSGWVAEGCGSTSSFYNFETSGNLTGFHSAIRLISSSSTPWQVSNFITGGFGAVGTRDQSLVTYADGRPYMEGSVAYFTSTSCDPNAGCYDGVYSYDVVSGTLTEIGAIFNNRSGLILNDQASHLVYDPGLDEYRYMVGGYGNSSPPPTFYGAWSRSAFDPLAGAVGVVAAATQMSFSVAGTEFDAHFACSQWNYSAGTCGKWLVGYANGNGNQVGNSSTSDPSANSWSPIGSIGTHYAEGERVIRTATGSGGVNYEITFVSAANGSFAGGRENTSYPTFSSASFGSVGTITAQIPGGAVNPPHPQIFSYGNTEYFVTFDGVFWGQTANTMGNWLVGTAPKYSAQPSYPQFVQGTSAFGSGSAASVTSGALPVTTGDLVIGYCRGASTAASSVTMSSSVSMGAFSGPGFDLITTGSGEGYGQAFYVFATATGSSTFTCTPNVSSSFQGITVMVYHPGPLTTADYGAIANQTGSSNAVYTSPSFSTTAKGMIVVCADALFGVGNFVPGFIGPYAAGPANGLSTGAALCMSTVTPSAQSSITANAGTTSGTPAQWGGAIMAFK